MVNLMSAPGAGKTTLLERVLVDGLARSARGGAGGRRPGVVRCGAPLGAARPGHPAEHRPGFRRRVPPGRQHGPLGAARAAARGDRPAGDRERRQPRLPRGVPRRRGRPRDGLLGHRGRGQAAEVPADVPRVRAGGDQQDRPPPPPRLLARALPREPRAGQPRRRAHAPERPHRRGRGRLRRVASAWRVQTHSRRERLVSSPSDRAREDSHHERLAARVDELLALRTTASERYFEAGRRAARAAVSPRSPSASPAEGGCSPSRARRRRARTRAMWRSSSSTR